MQMDMRLNNYYYLIFQVQYEQSPLLMIEDVCLSLCVC